MMHTPFWTRAMTLAAVVALAFAAVACGDSDDGDGDGQQASADRADKAASTADGQQLRAAVLRLQRSFADGDAKTVCQTLTEPARRQTAQLTQGTGSKTCVGFVEGLIRLRRQTNIEVPIPRIVATEIDGARATVKMKEGNRPATDMPFFKVDGEWKANVALGADPAAQRVREAP